LSAVSFVAEHIMGFPRGYCQGTYGGGSATSSGVQTWQYCDRCGAEIRNGNAGLCPKYPFPNFSLCELMRRLGAMGHAVMVRYDPLRQADRFTITFDGARVCDTDEPFAALCEYLKDVNSKEEWIGLGRSGFGKGACSALATGSPECGL